jgi:hypothetical protein
MTGSTKRTLALVIATTSALSGCSEWGRTGTHLDRLKPDAAAHAKALAGDDMAEARETGLALLAKLGALADW